MSHQHNAGQKHNTKTANNFLENEENFKYLGTILKIIIIFTKKVRADYIWGIFLSFGPKLFVFSFFI
jgi:hypothetical protein